MTKTIAGAIRWDYQYRGPSNNSAVSTALLELQSLETYDFSSRAPLHFSSLGSNKGQWNDSQTTFDEEIIAASSAGLKYWAFFRQSVGTYPNSNRIVHDSNGDYGFMYYQSSTKNNMINWCSMYNPSILGSTGNFNTQVSLIVQEFQQSNYQMVLTNRPVFYIYWDSNSITTNWGGSNSNFAAFITSLRAATIAVGLGTPYIVVLNGLDVTVLNSIGADANGSYYISPPNALAYPWTTFEPTIESYWSSMAALGKPFVPIVMTGFDPRPRIKRPVFKLSPSFPYIGLNQYVVAPTNTQLTSHISAAISYISTNQSLCPASLLLIYAWNEHSENGNVLNPCVGDPTGSRCAAAGSALIGN